jgi:hypothetical protein
MFLGKSHEIKAKLKKEKNAAEMKRTSTKQDLEFAPARFKSHAGKLNLKTFEKFVAHSKKRL